MVFPDPIELSIEFEVDSFVLYANTYWEGEVDKNGRPTHIDYTVTSGCLALGDYPDLGDEVVDTVFRSWETEFLLHAEDELLEEAERLGYEAEEKDTEA